MHKSPTFHKKKIGAEQLALYFLNQPSPTKSTNIRKIINESNQEKFSTLRDSLIYDDEDYYINNNNTNTHNINNNIHNNNNNDNNSSYNISNPIYDGNLSIISNPNNIKKYPILFSIPLKPFKPSSFKIPEKFATLTSRHSILFSGSNLNTHDITNSESDLLEIDEKVPIDKLIQFTSQKSFVFQESFNFEMLYNIDQVYKDIIKEFKTNNNNNGVNHICKEKLAGNFLYLMLRDDNNLGDIFKFNKYINKFLTKQLCLFLIILFISDLPELTQFNVMDIQTCLSYAHLNFVYVIHLVIINYSNEDIVDIAILAEDEGYEKCLSILKEYSHVNFNKDNYITYFHSQSKVVKSLLTTLLLNLKQTNTNTNVNVVDVIYNYLLQKNKTKFNEIITDIKSNETIMHKYNSIYDECDEDEEQQQPSIPYLQPKDTLTLSKEYTLVLDLDETLIHSIKNNDGQTPKALVRKGTELFIEKLSEYCEIVIFTAGKQDYADSIIDNLDCADKVSYRLYREHTYIHNESIIKDISRLGRDLAKVVIVDDIEDNYQLQKENGLHISEYIGDDNDMELLYLMDDLIEMFKNKGIDVREYLPHIRNKMKERYEL